MVTASRRAEHSVSSTAWSTPVDYRPLKPDFAVTGSLTVVSETAPGGPPTCNGRRSS